MLRRSILAILLTLLVGLSASAEDWATEMFQTTAHDFGPVARGAKAEFEFLLSNIYVEDVHIAAVRSSCGCTDARIKHPTLKTHEKGAIVATFNTQAFLGRKGATLTVTFDKPFHAQVQLHVRGYIRNDVLLEPGSVEFGGVEQGTAADKVISISHTGRNDWKILDVKIANPHISAELEETGRDGGRVSYQLSVHLAKDAPPGYFKDHLMLLTNDRHSSEVPILVEGQMHSAVTVSPASLFMGVVEPGQKVTKQLVVRGNKPFRVLSVSCDQGCLEFGTSADQKPKSVHLIPVTFIAGKESGKVVRTIRIVTDLGNSVPPLSACAVVLGK